MNYKVSKECKEQVISWLNTMQDGDRLVVSNGELVFYNNEHCEINRVLINL